ncbi:MULTISPECIES: triose-phosphate isomerase [Enterococcus]|uniref:triose-phosphate isomerase n=1 Tax=Enterococcus TaxID=1350 RepID=UPI0002D9BC9E|nr:triose-phosphate isomerase [Enterococcus mundtii]MDB7102730.1 triose-phosphate isomerase [Enterococcus mundtii]
MQKRTLRAPFFVVNPKAYLYGDQALALAKVADELSGTHDIDILFTVQHVDAARIKNETDHLFITVQHLDGLQVGRGMGYILPEALAEVGVTATFLNHAEHPMTVNELTKAVKRADELGILTIVCADSIAEAQAVASLDPDVMVCEPTELIGTGQSSDISYMKATNEAVRAMNPTIQILQAAGISTVEDVEKALLSGADGTGGTSGIVAADDPAQTLTNMIQKVAELKKELK